MDAIGADEPPRLGLRERKKAKTRALIQEHALRLFREQGYDATSVEQIAEAAEVSPSTVFRYFPTKPDLVIYDDLDERMIEAFRAQPPELNALQALRAFVSVRFRGSGRRRDGPPAGTRAADAQRAGAAVGHARRAGEDRGRDRRPRGRAFAPTGR